MIATNMPLYLKESGSVVGLYTVIETPAATAWPVNIQTGRSYGAKYFIELDGRRTNCDSRLHVDLRDISGTRKRTDG